MHALGDSAVLGSREYGLSVVAQHHARDGGLLIPTPNQETQKHKNTKTISTTLVTVLFIMMWVIEV